MEKLIFQQNIHKDDVVGVAEKRMYKRTNPHFICFSLCRPNSKVIPIDCFNNKKSKTKTNYNFIKNIDRNHMNKNN